jgi:hypothetical protein
MQSKNKKEKTRGGLAPAQKALMDISVEELLTWAVTEYLKKQK